MKYFSSVVCTAALFTSMMACAQQRNDVPGCYAHAKLAPELSTPVDSRELFVVLDATFSPDEKIKKLVSDKVQRFIKPGDRISVISFSAFVSDNYTDLKFTGLLDTNIQDRDDVAKKSLQILDNCLAKQNVFARSKIEQAISDGYRKDDTLPKTEIIANLAQVVGPRVAGSSANRKVVLLVSDLFENSDITSFYSNNQIRIIQPEAEMSKVQTAEMLTDFAGAEIYVVGAGWLEADYRGFRGTKMMMPLRKFWQSYFEASNAVVKGFGQPMLIEDL